MAPDGYGREMGTGQWEYLYIHVYTNNLEDLDTQLTKAGAAGFEMCGWASADKTIGLNAWVAILKRPGKRPNYPEGGKKAAADWYPDPLGRHKKRYWSGQYWTEHVADGGDQSIDVPGFDGA
jgi:hypothetical protein